MVRVARMMAVEHVRQAADEAGIDLAEIQRQLREQCVRQDLYEPHGKPPAPAQPSGTSVPTVASAASLTTPPRPVLPRRVRATRRPPVNGGATIVTLDGRREAA